MDFLKILTLTQPFKRLLHLRKSHVSYGVHRHLLLEPVVIQMKQGAVPISLRPLLIEQKSNLLLQCRSAVQCLFIYELPEVRVSISDYIQSKDGMLQNGK
jgi:hypothetical protein